MIPVVSISHLITLPFLIVISLRLLSSFLKDKDKNIGYFFVVFFSLTVMEALLSSPGLIFKDLSDIGLIFAVYPFFVFFGIGFWGAIPFGMLKIWKLEKIFLICLILIAIAVAAINLKNLQSAIVYNYPPFVYWEDARGTAMNLFIGFLSGLILLFLIIFFFANGAKSAERYVKKRSFLIGGGIIGFYLASLINFVVGGPYSNYKHISSLISAILLIGSSIIIFTGISYKEKKEPKEKPPLEIKTDYPKIQW